MRLAILCLLIASSFKATNAFAPPQQKTRLLSTWVHAKNPFAVTILDTSSSVETVKTNTSVNAEQQQKLGRIGKASIRTAALATVLGTLLLVRRNLAITRLFAFAGRIIARGLIGCVVSLFLWSTYSSRTKNLLKKGSFGMMEVLSETRDAYGNATNIPSIAERFEEGNPESIRNFVHLARSHPTETAMREDAGTIRVHEDVAIQYAPEGKEWALYGRREPTTLSLRELVSEKTPLFSVEEDVLKRINWDKKIGDCVPLPDGAQGVKGSYRWCYRDYVNHEELIGMMWKRGGIENFLFKIGGAGIIDIDAESKKCTLTERSKMFCFLPIAIVWEGTLEDGSIRWYTSSFTLGWRRFQKFFDKPAAAEKLRKDPWHISVPENDSSGDVLCFDRESVGNLVFAREECLSK